MKTNLLLMTLVLTSAGQAHAIAVVGGSGVTPVATVELVTKPSAAADDSSSLREGTITAVSEKGDQIQVNGSWFKLAATRIFRGGRAVKSNELATGQTVRFTLAPGGADRSALGVVYVP